MLKIPGDLVDEPNSRWLRAGDICFGEYQQKTLGKPRNMFVTEHTLILVTKGAKIFRFPDHEVVFMRYDFAKETTDLAIRKNIDLLAGTGIDLWIIFKITDGVRVPEKEFIALVEGVLPYAHEKNRSETRCYWARTRNAIRTHPSYHPFLQNMATLEGRAKVALAKACYSFWKGQQFSPRYEIILCTYYYPVPCHSDL